MVRKVLRGISRPSNWIPLIPILVFLVAAQVWPQNKLAIMTNALDIGAWFLIMRAYVPPFYRKLREGRSHDAADLYLLGGNLLNVSALAASRIWSLGIILAGKPAWMINHWFQSFCYLLAALSYYYYLRVPKSDTSRRYITYALAIAAVLGGIILLFTEN